MRGDRIPKLSETLGPWAELRNIRPPEPSFVDLERYLREIAPYCAIDGDGRPTVFGVNIRRWKIRLEDAQNEGLTYEQAALLWAASAEREGAAIREAMDYTARAASRALKERNDTRRGNGPARSKQRYGIDTQSTDFEDYTEPLEGII